jgi:hypothetical protein
VLLASETSNENIAKTVPFAGALLKKEVDYDYFISNYTVKQGENYVLKKQF